MRLSFASGERADFSVDGGVVNLGSAGGNGIVLPGKDVAPWHARLSLDQRGIVLEVMDPAARTHVNGRPVREKALLRCGDTVCLGSTVIVLRAEPEAIGPVALPPERPGGPAPVAPARVVLRGVSGCHFGKAIAVNRRLVVGTADGCDLVLDEARVSARHAAIELDGDRLWLRNLDAGDGTLLNGVCVRDAAIHAGDQLAFAHSHFVVEAPGFAARGESPPIAVDASADEDAPAADEHAGSGHGGTWWLIGAAALIALVLVLLIHRGL
ncbi:FHA domain-containing protein [Dokdonella sp.]|uniref:FHA domain-containing protein n=1 Tax=Dokdonella sp. TaxID=2291710 RepID=UPI002F3EC619